MRNCMIKIRILVILLFSVVNNVEPMVENVESVVEWLKSPFQGFTQTKPTQTQPPQKVNVPADVQDLADDPDEAEKNPPLEHNSSLFDLFCQKSERIIADTKAKSQEILIRLSPQKAHHPKKTEQEPSFIQLEEYSSESDDQEACNTSDNDVVNPVLGKNSPTRSREKEEIRGSLLSPEKNRFIKYLGLSIISVSMGALLYNCLKSYNESPTYRKRPWH